METSIRRSAFSSEMAMAKQVISKSWILEAVTYFVFLLIAAHVFALAYWIYRLATDRPKEKQPQRRKAS